MRYIFIIPIIALTLFGCKQQPEYTKLSTLDSLQIRQKASKMTDSIIGKIKTDATTGLYEKSKNSSPVFIKKCKITTDEYGSKDVDITLTNQSKKKIDGLKVSWILYNNFNEQVATGNGIAQKKLSSGKTTTYSWSIYSPVTHAKAFIYSVHYTDGTTWKLEGTY